MRKVSVKLPIDCFIVSLVASEFFIKIKDVDYNGCQSHVGYLKDVLFTNYQLLNLDPGDGIGGYGCLHESIIQHEFLHALGFKHEQTRPDRDEHIIIHPENIQNEYLYNFQMMKVKNWYDMDSPYDVQSVMHYGANSFLTSEAQSKSLPAMTSKLTGLPVQSPRVSRMSSQDCFQLQKMYEDHCPPLQTRQCANGEKYLKNRAW